MPVRSMRFAPVEATDHSSELKEALEAGLDAFRASGRVVTAEKANEAIRAAERALLEADDGPRSTGRARARPKVIRRSRYAKWTDEDFQALSEANWDILDPLWERVEAGEVVADVELTQTQQVAIERAYKKVPQDARTERWPDSKLISKLRYLVKAFKHAESR